MDIQPTNKWLLHRRISKLNLKCFAALLSPYAASAVYITCALMNFCGKYQVQTGTSTHTNAHMNESVDWKWALVELLMYTVPFVCPSVRPTVYSLLLYSVVLREEYIIAVLKTNEHTQFQLGENLLRDFYIFTHVHTLARTALPKTAPGRGEVCCAACIYIYIPL